VKLFFLYFLFFSQPALAQIADASFFPSMKSLNPGVSHLRELGFLAIDLSLHKVDKHQDVQTGGIQDGIQFDLEMQKNSFFRAGRGKGLTIELLAQQEKGEMVQSFTNLSGKSERTTNATSNFFGGIIDFEFFGVMVGKARFNYHFFLESGEPPDYWARDNDWAIDYDLLKIGKAFHYGPYRLGLFYLKQSSRGIVDFTFYDPATSNRGSTIPYNIDTEIQGYGVGLGYTTTMFHFEIAQEEWTGHSHRKAEDFPWDVKDPELASRLSVVLEARLSWFSLGVRFRQIKGNFYDLEDVMSSKLLYEDLAASDVRSETTFNFALSQKKGLSYSAFYSTSDVKSEEEVLILSNGYTYPTRTKTVAMGVNLSYLY
jgi:hypothetical protein